MKIEEVLNGKKTTVSVEEQKEFFEQMKNQKVFDLEEVNKTNLINFICESDIDVAIDYLFHVLDEEISYPIDDEKVKSLFSDDRMLKLKDLMLEKLQSETTEDEDEDELEDDSE